MTEEERHEEIRKHVLNVAQRLGLQASEVHIYKIELKQTNLNTKLETALQQAIQAENYESAAIIRDQIKQLKGESHE